MKILFLLSRIDRTGMTTNALDLGTELVRQGHSVVLLTSDVSEQEKEHLEFIRNRFLSSGMKLYFFKSRDSRYLLLNILNRLQIILYCIRKILLFNPKIIHSISPYMTIVPWLFQKKYIWTVHVCDLAQHLFLRPSELVISISNESSEYAKNQFHYIDSNIRKVLHGVNPRFSIASNKQEKTSFLHQLNIPTDKIIIGTVCAFEHRKGLDILLKGVDLLPKELKSEIAILIVGSEKYPGEQKRLDNIISSLNLNSLVTICSHCDPKIAYDVMDVFVLPSRLEGFGLVVVEAMLSKCCTIRSNTEGSSDQIEHGKTGFIFANEDFIEFSNYLRQVIEDGTLRKNIAENGYIYAKEHFLREQMCRNTLKVYEEIIG